MSLTADRDPMASEFSRGTKAGPERSRPMQHIHSGAAGLSVFDLMRKQPTTVEARLIKPWAPQPEPRGRR